MEDGHQMRDHVMSHEVHRRGVSVKGALEVNRLQARDGSGVVELRL